MLCASLERTGVWVGMDAHVCMAESLPCSPGIITTLLIGYPPVQNRKFSLKKKKKRTQYTYVTQQSQSETIFLKPRFCAGGYQHDVLHSLAPDSSLPTASVNPGHLEQFIQVEVPENKKQQIIHSTQWNMNLRDMKGTLVLVTHNFSIIDDHFYLPLFRNILSWSRTWISLNSQTPSH